MPMQYLVKPISKEECFDCLNEVYQSDRIRKYFVFDDLDKTFRVPHQDIIYIEKFAHNANVITVKGEYILRKTIAQLLEELNNDLCVKCHKSYIINIRHIDSLSKKYATMVNGSEVPLSKVMVKEINERFYKYNVHRV